MKPISFSNLLFLYVITTFISTPAMAVSNADMYRALRSVESTMGTNSGAKFANISLTTKDNAKQTFHYVYHGAADSNGRYTRYNLVTTMENKGSYVEIVSYSRKVPNKFHPALAQMVVKPFNKIKDDLADHGYNIEYVQLDEQWVSLTRVANSQFNNTSFWRFFVELGQFHGVITNNIYTLEREYGDDVYEREWNKIDPLEKFKIEGQVVEINGEDVFSDLLFFKFDDKNKDEYGQWSWFRKDEFLFEIKLRGASYEYAIHVDILDSLPQNQKDQLVKQLHAKAASNMPTGFSSVVVTINDLDLQGARVAFVYNFNGREGEDIKDHSLEFLEELDDLHALLSKIAQTYDGIDVQSYSNEDFNQLITEDSFYVEDATTKMGVGYWELIDFQDANFYVINYPNKMVLTTSVVFGEDWTTEELTENNLVFKNQLSAEDTLYADKVEVTFHPDTPKEVMLALEFNYATRSTKELFDIFEIYFVEGVGRTLNSKLLIAQGSEGLEPLTDE